MLHSSLRAARLLHVNTKNVGDGTERPGSELTLDPENICADRAEKNRLAGPSLPGCDKALVSKPLAPLRMRINLI